MWFRTVLYNTPSSFERSHCSGLSNTCILHSFTKMSTNNGRLYRIRTCDDAVKVRSVTATLRANCMVGKGRFELPTFRLSGERSNQLSYIPIKWWGFVFRRLPKTSRRPLFSASLKAGLAVSASADMVGRPGLEPGTGRLKVYCDTISPTTLNGGKRWS
jgi:hypothetical protein